MADCGSFDDAAAAVDAGADLIGTTLSGYTGERPKTDGPDLELLEQIAAAGLGDPLIAEGRIHTPAQARQALDAGAFAVVVGTAITHPASITGWFKGALRRLTCLAAGVAYSPATSLSLSLMPSKCLCRRSAARALSRLATAS